MPLVRQQNILYPGQAGNPLALPLNRVPTVIIEAPPATFARKLTRHQLLLHSNGIIIRDFAYESNLPPVQRTVQTARGQFPSRSAVIQREFLLSQVSEEYIKSYREAKRRELMVSRGRMSDGQVRPDIGHWYELSMTKSSGASARNVKFAQNN